MAVVKCDWCRNFYKENEKYPHTCAFCGGPEPEPKRVPESHTYFYKDWWVVQVRDFLSATFCLRFYAGRELQAEIELSEEELYQNVEAGLDPMPYIEKKLEEKGVTIPSVVWERIQEKRTQRWLTS